MHNRGHDSEHHGSNHEVTPQEFKSSPSMAGDLQTILQVAGVDCAEEVAAIHRALKPMPGVRDVKVSIVSGKAVIVHDQHTAVDGLIKAINATGLKANREGEKLEDDAHQAQKRRLIFVSTSGAFTFIGLLVQWTAFAPKPAATLCFIAAIVCGGWLIAPKAITAARRLAPDMNLLMSIAVLGAAGIGEWSEGAAVSFLFTLSELLESFSVSRARRAIQSLLQLAPEMALLKKGDSFEEVPVETVQIGAVVVVKSGTRVPLDGEVLSGVSSIDQALITGESMPVEKESRATRFSLGLSMAKVL